MANIVIIDDSDTDRMIVECILEDNDSNLNLKSFFCAKDALSYFSDTSEDQAADFILLDINMPEIDGFEFLEQYSQMPASERTPVIMHSSSNCKKDKERALSFECVIDYTEKIIEDESLKAILTKLQ